MSFLPPIILKITIQVHFNKCSRDINRFIVQNLFLGMGTDKLEFAEMSGADSLLAEPELADLGPAFHTVCEIMLFSLYDSVMFFILKSK